MYDYNKSNNANKVARLNKLIPKFSYFNFNIFVHMVCGKKNVWQFNISST